MMEAQGIETRKGNLMARCVRCGGDPHYHIQLMEVRTYQNPLIYEQEPVQVVERTVEMDVCRDCARRQLRADLRLLSGKEGFQLGLVALMTALCLWAYRSGQSAAMLPGAAACLALGVGCTFLEAWTRHKRYASMPEPEQQGGGAETIYIPVTAGTMRLCSDDLMIGFDLQPEVSDRVWDLLHHAGSCASC